MFAVISVTLKRLLKMAGHELMEISISSVRSLMVIQRLVRLDRSELFRDMLWSRFELGYSHTSFRAGSQQSDGKARSTRRFILSTFSPVILVKGLRK